MIDRNWWHTRLAGAVEDSRWGQAFANSLLCRSLWRALHLTVRLLDARSSLMARALARLPPSDFSLAADLVTRSGLYQVARGAAGAFGRDAWRVSVVGGFYGHHIGPLNPRTRVRLAAWMILVAALVRAAADYRGVSSSRAAVILWVSVVIASLLVFAVTSTSKRDAS